MIRELACALALLCIASAALAEPASGCRGSYHLFRPVPRACLEEIEADRPGMTDSPRAVDPGHAQLELGLFSYSLPHLGGDPPEALDLDLVVKVGLARGRGCCSP